MGNTTHHSRGEWENGRRIDPLTDEQRRLVEDTYPIAIRYAVRYMRRWLSAHEMEDALGQAAVALCQAARNFDPDAGSWHAFWRVRVAGELLTYVASRRSGGFSGSRRAFKRGAMVRVDSLDKDVVVGFDGRGLTAGASLVDDHSEHVGWEIELEEERRRLARLAARGNEVVRRGLEAYLMRADCVSLEAAGRVAGVTQSRMSQLKAERLYPIVAREMGARNRS